MTPFLDVLARLEAEATPQDWQIVPGNWHGVSEVVGQEDEVGRAARITRSCSSADAVFIAALRNAAPLLIEVARAADDLLTENARYRRQPDAGRMHDHANAERVLDAALSALRAETERGGT